MKIFMKMTQYKDANIMTQYDMISRFLHNLIIN